MAKKTGERIDRDVLDRTVTIYFFPGTKIDIDVPVCSNYIIPYR